jgi:hypothetical protein
MLTIFLTRHAVLWEADFIWIFCLDNQPIGHLIGKNENNNCLRLLWGWNNICKLPSLVVPSLEHSRAPYYLVCDPHLVKRKPSPHSSPILSSKLLTNTYKNFPRAFKQKPQLRPFPSKLPGYPSKLVRTFSTEG